MSIKKSNKNESVNSRLSVGGLSNLRFICGVRGYNTFKIYLRNAVLNGKICVLNIVAD